MTTNDENKGTGFTRWWIVLLIVLAVVIPGYLAPIKPPVQLPGEIITGPFFNFLGQDFYLTNTLLTTGIVYLILFFIAFLVRRGLGDEKTPSRGLALAFEAIIEAIYNLVESTAGSKWARQMFPWVATIILVVLTSNYTKLLPGIETIGVLHEVHGGHEGYAAANLIPGVSYIYKAEKAAEDTHAEDTHAEDEHAAAGYNIIPFFRGPSTDLNFTAAIAITAMFMVQYFGFKANGLGYLSKFFNFGGFLKIWTTKKVGPFDVIMPFIDIFVGLLELIAEIAKIVSFSFRLLGALFGGAILLGVIGTLMPAAQFGVLFLELFVGLVQSLVFGVLALVFMTVATQSHGHGDEEHAH